MKKCCLQILWILLIAAMVALVGNYLHPNRIPWVQDWSHQIEAKAADKGVTVISLRTAVDLLADGAHLFIDARPTEAYEKGHIPGAVSLPFQELDTLFDRIEPLLDDPRPAVVYCSSRECDESLLLTGELQDMGRSNLLLYVDGYDLWSATGEPIE